MIHRIQLPLILIILVGIGCSEFLANRIQIQAQAESFRTLAQAVSKEELKEAVGGLGIFFEFPDGGWVAIRYRDYHGGTIWSSAVARDSGGAWYTSEEHYCGLFLHYNQLKKDPQREYAAKQKALLLLGESANLAAARQQIVNLGFRQVNPP